MFFKLLIHDQFKPPSLCCQVKETYGHIFFVTLKTGVFHLLSSPTLYLRRSAEVKMCEGCRMENFGGGGGESRPLGPLVFHLVSSYSALSL